MIAFLFSVTIVILAISASYSVSILSRSIEKSSNKIEILNSDVDYLERTIKYINSNKKLLQIEDKNTVITFKDLSSKLDLNFLDFTLFKNNSYRSLLKPEYSWLSLQEFRDQIGFTADIYKYRKFFIENINYKDIVTVYSLPNINNCSDLMVQLYYEIVIKDKIKAKNLKDYMQNRRKSKKPIDKKEFKNLIQLYDIEDVLTIIPSWNKEFLETTMISKSNNLSKMSKKLYLGDKTTFWEATIINSDTQLITTVIFRWFESENIYRPISITKELL